MVHCSKGFYLLLAALIYLDGQGLVLCSLFASALHELGHLAVIYLLGGKVSALHLTAVGADMELHQQYTLSYGKEALAAVAGPVVSLIAAAVSMETKLYLFAWINLCLGVLNLLPVYPLDGGRVLVCIVSLLNIDHAEEAKKISSVIVSGLALGLGVAAWYRFGNITLLIGAVWLAFSAIKQ